MGGSCGDTDTKQSLGEFRDATTIMIYIFHTRNIYNKHTERR